MNGLVSRIGVCKVDRDDLRGDGLGIDPILIKLLGKLSGFGLGLLTSPVEVVDDVVDNVDSEDDDIE